MILIEKIQAIANDIYSVLGNEHDEATYKNAMEIAFMLDKFSYSREMDLPIYYRGHIVGRGKADFIVYGDSPLAIEVKASSSWGVAPEPQYVSQLNNYMFAAKTTCGLLINYPQAGTSLKKQPVNEPEFHIIQPLK